MLFVCFVCAWMCVYVCGMLVSRSLCFLWFVIHTRTQVHTGRHSESIQTPSLFSDFVTLQPDVKIVYIHFPLINLYLISHNNKVKTGFYFIFKFIKKEKLKYPIEVFRPFTMTHEIYFPFSSDHLWDVSAPWLESTCGKFNEMYMIWKGTHLSNLSHLYKVSHGWQCMSEKKTKPWGRTNCRQSSRDPVCRVEKLSEGKPPLQHHSTGLGVVAE